MAEIIIHGQSYELPPLNAGQVRRNWSSLAKMISHLDAGSNMDRLSGIGDLTGAKMELILVAMQNDFPEITMEDMESLFLPDIDNALIALINVTRLGKVKRETATEAGNP